MNLTPGLEQENVKVRAASNEGSRNLPKSLKLQEITAKFLSLVVIELLSKARSRSCFRRDPIFDVDVIGNDDAPDPSKSSRSSFSRSTKRDKNKFNYTIFLSKVWTSKALKVYWECDTLKNYVKDGVIAQRYHSLFSPSCLGFNGESYEKHL